MAIFGYVGAAVSAVTTWSRSTGGGLNKSVAGNGMRYVNMESSNRKYHLVGVQFNQDDRAQRWLDIDPSLDGHQINISRIMSTSHIVAWHKHEKQSDLWFCIQGAVKVGLSDGDMTEFVVLSDKCPDALFIPPGIYHGYKALEPGSILLYSLDQKYDPDDEFRAKPGDFGESWETPNK